MGNFLIKTTASISKDEMLATMGILLFEMLSMSFCCFVSAPLNTIQNSLEIFSAQIVLTYSSPITTLSSNIYLDLCHLHFILNDLKCYGIVAVSSRKHL
jgi:hypothetical protein